MHITLESDYAVRIVHCLAVEPVRMDAKTIAEKTEVTLRFSLKILRKLVASEIVKSYKGTRGGYELAKEPKDITLREVIETVEGPYVLSRCVRPDFQCEHTENKCCKFNKIYEEISGMVREKLDSVTFQDIIER